MKLELNITKRVAAFAAAVILLPMGALAGAKVVERAKLNAEAAEYAKVCEAAAPDVIRALEYSIDAQKRYVSLLKVLLEGNSDSHILYGASFLLTSEAASMAHEDAAQAFFEGGEDSFYRQCDRARFLIDDEDNPIWDEEIEHLFDASPAALRAIDLYDQDYDLREEIKDLEDALTRQLGF